MEAGTTENFKGYEAALYDGSAFDLDQQKLEEILDAFAAFSDVSSVASAVDLPKERIREILADTTLERVAMERKRRMLGVSLRAVMWDVLWLIIKRADRPQYTLKAIEMLRDEFKEYDRQKEAPEMTSGDDENFTFEDALEKA